jgi:hypothetical protein
LEINPSIIKTMVKEKDIEGLQAAAEEMGIKLKALEKRNAKTIGEKLIEALSEKPVKKEKAEKPKKKEKVSVWAMIVEMLGEGESAIKIKKAIIPILIEMGIDEDEAEKKAKVLIEVAKAGE